LASAGGALSATLYMWVVFKKPDPSFMCNGLLAGLVAITAPCAYVTPSAAVFIGLLAGVLVVLGCLFVERVLKVDDPVGAVGVHGINGAWGVLALGLFADGTYGAGANGSFWYKMKDGSLQWFAEELKELPDNVLAPQGVTGLFYGNPSQFTAELIGVVSNLIWVGAAAWLVFWMLDKLFGNRVSPEVEVQGLDIHEMGVLGYINEDPKSPEGHVAHPPMEPRRALTPPNGKRFTVVIEGVDARVLREIWSDLCLPSAEEPSQDFRAVYPFVTTLEGKTFRFRDGDPETMRDALARLLRKNIRGAAVGARVERLAEGNSNRISQLV
jgi:hypothetical protein